MAPCHFGCFLAILTVFWPFWTHLDQELHLDGVQKCPTYLLPLPEVCFRTLTCFQVDFFTQYGAMSFWLFFGHFGCFLAILGPPGPGITPGWGTKCPTYLLPLPEVCYDTLTCFQVDFFTQYGACLLYTSPSPRDATLSRMPSSA